MPMVLCLWCYAYGAMCGVGGTGIAYALCGVYGATRYAVLSLRMVLPGSYAMSGTELAYGLLSTTACDVWYWARVWCRAMCGTELAYAAMSRSEAEALREQVRRLEREVEKGRERERERGREGDTARETEERRERERRERERVEEEHREEREQWRAGARRLSLSPTRFLCAVRVRYCSVWYYACGTGIAYGAMRDLRGRGCTGRYLPTLCCYDAVVLSYCDTMALYGPTVLRYYYLRTRYAIPSADIAHLPGMLLRTSYTMSGTDIPLYTTRSRIWYCPPSASSRRTLGAVVPQDPRDHARRTLRSVVLIGAMLLSGGGGEEGGGRPGAS
eukprot:1498358-Rhodomonas_salina.1